MNFHAASQEPCCLWPAAPFGEFSGEALAAAHCLSWGSFLKSSPKRHWLPSAWQLEQGIWQLRALNTLHGRAPLSGMYSQEVYYLSIWVFFLWNKPVCFVEYPVGERKQLLIFIQFSNWFICFFEWKHLCVPFVCLSYISVFKTTITKESPLGGGLITATNPWLRKRIFYCNNVWSQYLSGTPVGFIWLSWDPVYHVLPPLLC